MEHDKEKRTSLIRDGQSRKQRFPKELDPFFARIDDRTRKELLKFAAEYAKELKYFDSDTNRPDGDWRPFFEAVGGADITKLKGYDTHEPHIALYLAFLLLFRHAQKYMNGLTGRHLDFYYQDVLGFRKRGPLPDKTHVVFELKKKVSDQLIEAGTLLKAGKDSRGKELFYALTEDLLLTRSEIRGLRSVFVTSGNVVHIAPVANSSDGLGGELKSDEPKWRPFGHEGLPKADIGFAIASPLLALKGGIRTVTVHLSLSYLGETDPDSLKEVLFSVYLTAEKGWIGPKQVSLEQVPGTNGQFRFSFTLQKDEGAVAAYSADIHGSNFETSSPLMQVLLNMEKSDGGYTYSREVRVKSLRLTVEDSGIEDLTIENDLGSIAPGKSFMPFGPNPEKGSRFYIGHEEAFAKNLDGFSIGITWKVPSGDLSSCYTNYTTKVSNSYFKAKLTAPDGTTWNSVDLFDGTDAARPVVIPGKKKKVRVKPLEAIEYKPYALLQQNNKWAMNELKMINLTSKVPILQQAAGRVSVPSKKGYIVLHLLTDFLHKEYRELYTTRIIKYTKGETKTLTLPGEPYTPVIRSIRLGYSASTAETDLTSISEKDYLNKELEFFHVTAFGQMRVHRFLKKQLEFDVDENIYMLPQYREEGEFYVGLENVKPLQNLPLLLQAAEGSANPGKERPDITWSILSDNYWRELKESEILSDTTNGLLTSGIIKFFIPAEATSSNTILPGGCCWLRAAIGKETDAATQLVDVRANAVLAAFRDRDNDPAHLGKPLKAGSIRKLAEPLAAIKTIEQPYASFGGEMSENRDLFYSRVSERLRHKNRSVDIWDYERMPLENFPSIYKAKCISHSSLDSYNAPGHVTVVVVPDLRNRNAVDRLKPKAPKDTLSEIEDFLGRHAGAFVRIHVTNPSYEEVKLDFKVAFRRGCDFGYHKGALNEEIKRFLSPWAFDDGKDIAFGGRVHKSVILNFIEEIPYVDYVTDFKMFHIVRGKAATDTETATVSEPKAILVSYNEHSIEKV